MTEATKSLPESFKESRPTVPWRDIYAMRILLTHVYDEIDDDAVWVAVTVEAPELLRLIAA
ncbi:MAG: DUF86 domain-containing protein [Cellulomonadaceae bacterium]|nr:DUF86 domain-containing protein [Cellulomonadaceae bacterium]